MIDNFYLRVVFVWNIGVKFPEATVLKIMVFNVSWRKGIWVGLLNACSSMFHESYSIFILRLHDQNPNPYHCLPITNRYWVCVTRFLPSNQRWNWNIRHLYIHRWFSNYGVRLPEVILVYSFTRVLKFWFKATCQNQVLGCFKHAKKCV